MSKRILDVLIVCWLAALVALWATGGWELDVLGVHITSHRAGSLLSVLSGLVALRIALAAGAVGTLTIVGSTVAALGAAELFLRWLDPAAAYDRLPQIVRPSATYGWELVPGASGVGYLGERIVIDAAGRRDEAPAPTSTQRVALVGDSFTFGMGVELGDTYGKQLERMLRAGDREAHVVSFGVAAYQLWQHVRVIENRVGDIHPSLVVLQLFYDDLLQPSPPDPPVGRNPFDEVTPDEFRGSRLWNLAKNNYRVVSARYRHLAGADYLSGIDERRAAIGPDGMWRDHYHVQIGALDHDTTAAVRQELERIAQWSSRRATPVVAVLIPDASQLHDVQRQGVNRYLAQELARLEIPFLDFTPIFEADSDPRSLYLLPFDAHTSPKANGLIAQGIARVQIVRHSRAADGVHGPGTGSASALPGQGGMVTPMQVSGPSVVDRN